MSYKNEISDKVAMALEDISCDDTGMIDIIETLYERALEESKMTGHSIESITYEILEGLGHGYHSQPDKIEYILKNATAIITKVIHRSAAQQIQKQHMKATLAQAQLLDTIEAEKMYLSESLEAFRQYAQDHAHTHFKASLHQTELDIMQMIHTLSDIVQEGK